MQELRDQVRLDVQYNVQQIGEDLSLDSLVCVDGVGLIKEQKCLDGTRTKILTEVIDWINNTDPATPRIFWLHGQAGKGKSAVAHTIALHAQNLGILGSCFCFSRTRQHEELHTMLFPTIARSLADHDVRLRSLLAEMMSKGCLLRDTEDVREQWEKFILEPLSRLEGFSTRNVVVVIDGLDESGARATRASVLEVLAAGDAQLPANIRILLTSRPLVDIRKALNVSQHVHVMSLDDIDTELTIRDIHLYVSYRLKGLRNTFSDANIQQISAKSGGVFEWARLACDFIVHPTVVGAKKRFDKIMSDAPGEGRTFLDAMYIDTLKEFTKGSHDVLRKFRSIMRQVLWSKEPLSVVALNFVRERFPREDNRYPVGDILNSLASLLSCGETSPVRPLHTSFYHFLLDEKRSGEFFIDQGDVHHSLAVASISVMQTCLCFNICGLETSYVPNVQVADLERRVEENIPPHLLYACQWWTTHLQHAAFDVELAQLVGRLVTGEKMLFWLEVLGVSKLIWMAHSALRTVERWFKVSMILSSCMYNMSMGN